MCSGLLLTACGAKSSAKQQITINIASDGATKPFDYTVNGSETGYDIEVAKAVFAKLPEYKANFETMDFNTIAGAIDSGHVDIGANDFGWNSQRAAKYYFSSPLSKSNNVVVVKSGTYKTLADLAGKSTESEPASNYTTLIQDYNKTVSSSKQIKINFVSGQTPFTSRLSDIQTGKIDFVLYDAISAKSAIKDMGYSDLKTENIETQAGDPTHDGYEYFLFAKTSAGKALQTKVNKVLKELQADGTLKKLSEKYLGGDFVPAASLFS
ncbi:MAG: transporter substrate-binding domain-containing protein [Streptococcaceae bacterium]|jgi:polar amino acid transport system substrate-binding protein|nr:transporter substrate-binding domain-containing protein [Streptococcaceae bacterium]